MVLYFTFKSMALFKFTFVWISGGFVSVFACEYTTTTAPLLKRAPFLLHCSSTSVRNQLGMFVCLVMGSLLCSTALYVCLGYCVQSAFSDSVLLSDCFQTNFKTITMYWLLQPM